MKKTNAVVSLGQACALIHAMPDRIKATAATLDLQPVMRINLVDHYAEADIQRIGEHLRAEATNRPTAGAT